MKYFTPQLWLGFNSRSTRRRDAAFKAWDLRLSAYRKSLRKILPGLGSKAQKFFGDVLVLHDSTLTRLEVGDGIHHSEHEFGPADVKRRKITVRMLVFSDSRNLLYVLEYKGVTKVELDFPGKLELFPVEMYPNFGDWGYDELTSPTTGLYRHEILFASGASIVVEFGDLTFHRKRMKQSTKR
jgi:hypothetical protein